MGESSINLDFPLSCMIAGVCLYIYIYIVCIYIYIYYYYYYYYYYYDYYYHYHYYYYHYYYYYYIFIYVYIKLYKLHIILQKSPCPASKPRKHIATTMAWRPLPSMGPLSPRVLLKFHVVEMGLSIG